MNNQELFRLFKDSKLAQVAKPLSKRLRGNQKGPTHQIIYTPKSSAVRSSFGIKTALPQQIGFSHIVYNDIDNAKNLPDVEKYAGTFYNRIKFQEMGVPIKTESPENPLFRTESTKTPRQAKHFDGSNEDSVSYGLNLKATTPTNKVKKILNKNPSLYKKFNEYMIKNYPDKLLSNVSKNESKLVNEFLNSAKDLYKEKTTIFNKNFSKIQGTGGFSYLQKGRLTNTPNGIKYGTIAPGRIINARDAAIGGFIATVNDRSSLQRNYTKNYPGKHQRQFVVPFQIANAEITNSGKVRLEANGVHKGSYEGNNYPSLNKNITSSSERVATDMKQFSALLSILEDPQAPETK